MFVEVFLMAAVQQNHEYNYRMQWAIPTGIDTSWVAAHSQAATIADREFLNSQWGACSLSTVVLQTMGNKTKFIQLFNINLPTPCIIEESYQIINLCIQFCV